MYRFLVSTPLGLGIGALMLVPACAPAPLYTGNGRVKGAVTSGEIPRDARGEPVWSAIRPPAQPNGGVSAATLPPPPDR